MAFALLHYIDFVFCKLQINNNNTNKKLSEEELEYVQKLAKENKADFLITK